MVFVLGYKEFYLKGHKVNLCLRFMSKVTGVFLKRKLEPENNRTLPRII